ncbi:DUF5060 domain-containing protein [Flammeovirga yaeyamensis]|uniref:DUF5060 domain-containing protein n=2 Tax=Flammeovirga yaeyamensis TaxID=367791 RepID=A0AAX1NE29_9BACT|nr:DUF5060 domain-containing protein [Flammeovirga yaeyamensis]MBB3696725.1 hypothetical protein [Flammeovirga yaeyamensis]NMF33395.1 DUF5060 domain-containing protein [Flammeovirga yaeyamensis]QWG05331.1 DUF5060 domain-containing protein [Flammeovirga yaeyamensis]
MRTNLLIILLLTTGILSNAQTISGEQKVGHKVSITFDGPKTSELDPVNPFLDYRLDVTFTNGDVQFVIPGFYAADGNAGETSADAGNKWKVRFTPNKIGEWSYTASFVKGKNIAVADDISKAEKVSFDGTKGSFNVDQTDKSGRDLRAKGRLLPTDTHYLQFEGNKEYFIKGGVNSPEDLLGYHEFDQTSKKHKFENHIQDWKEGDVTWKDGKGKALIGAMNYMASTGINTVYFLTMNVQGDGNNVWPWTESFERYRFNVSKLDQWEKVFTHMDQVGLVKHVITQETENENLLDIGYTGIQRKLYYRELVARFAHHPGIIWNMGEENGITNWSPVGQTAKMRNTMITYMKNLDPYGNPVVIHTLPSLKDHENTVTPLLGNKSLDGISFQVHHLEDTYKVTKKWRKASAKEGKKWVIWLDEIGPASHGVLPDDYPAQQDTVRKDVIWANLMAGGAGIEHYFGYKFPHNDLNCEDWRSRDRIWHMTYVATSFFQEYLPFTEMKAKNNLVDSKDSYVFAKEGDTYCVYLKEGGNPVLDLSDQEGKYSVRWYNPRTGGDLIKAKVKVITGGQKVALGSSPTFDDDWVALVRKL